MTLALAGLAIGVLLGLMWGACLGFALASRWMRGETDA